MPYLWEIDIKYGNLQRATLLILTSDMRVSRAESKAGEFLRQNQETYPEAQYERFSLMGRIDA